MTTAKTIKANASNVQRLAARRKGVRNEKAASVDATDLEKLRLRAKNLSLPEDCGSSMDAFLDELIDIWHAAHGRSTDEHQQVTGGAEPDFDQQPGSLASKKQGVGKSTRATTVNWGIGREPERMAADASGTNLMNRGLFVRTLVDLETGAVIATLEFRAAGRKRLRVTLMPSSRVDVNIFGSPGGSLIAQITTVSPEAKVDLGTQDITDDFILRHFVPVVRGSQD